MMRCDAEDNCNFSSPHDTGRAGEMNHTGLRECSVGKVNAALFRRERIAVVADEIVRSEHVGLLLSDQLAHGQGEILLKRVGVGLLGSVFPLLGSLKQGMVSAAQLRFQVAPGAMKRASGSAGLFHVMHAVLVEHLFQIASEAGSL